MKTFPFLMLALAGFTNLSAVRIDTDTIFTDVQSNSDAVGWSVLGSSNQESVNLTVTDGAILTKSNVNGDDYGISLGSSTIASTLLFEAGSLTVTDLESGAGSYGVQLLGASTANFNGGELIINESGNGVGYGYSLNHTSSLTVRGGTIRLTESAKGDAAAFYLRGSSTLKYRDGTVEMTEADQQDAVLFDCKDDSISIVYSGDFNVTSNGTVLLVRLSQNATFELAGGDYTDLSGTPLLKLTSNSSSLKLLGSGFELDTGNGFIPVDAGGINSLSGTVRMTMSDGNTLTASFTQPVAGQIQFVYVPTYGTVIMLSSFGAPFCLLIFLGMCLSAPFFKLCDGRRIWMR